jgi:hypothetical protein
MECRMESASNRPIKSNGNRPVSAGYRIRLIDLSWKSIENNFVGNLFMKRSEIFFSAMQLPIDIVMITLAALSAYYVRNIPQILALRPKLYDIALTSFMEVVFFVAPIFVLIFALEGLYQMRSTRRFLAGSLSGLSGDVACLGHRHRSDFSQA